MSSDLKSCAREEAQVLPWTHAMFGARDPWPVLRKLCDLLQYLRGGMAG